MTSFNYRLNVHERKINQYYYYYYYYNLELNPRLKREIFGSSFGF